MLKTYDVTCPDKLFCGAVFEVEMDPLTEEETVDCPHCGGEFDWVHEPETDTIILLWDGDDDDEDDALLLGDLEDDEDDEEDEDEEEEQEPA
jgi:uncharacterized Zn-finger protein